MSLRFIDFKKKRTVACDEPFGRELYARATQGRTTQPTRITKDGIARTAQALEPRGSKSFLKQTEYIHSTLDVGRSMFDVHQFFFD
jgi:hypothetical protein